MGRLEDRAKKGRAKAFEESAPNTQALLRLFRYLAMLKKKPGTIGTRPK